MHTWKRPLGLPWLLALALAGCTQAHSGGTDASAGLPPDSGGPVGQIPFDSGGVEVSEPADAPQDESKLGDAGACPMAIDAFCATTDSCGVSCPCLLDWGTASNFAKWCVTPRRVWLHPGCDGFNLAVVDYPDLSILYYYDPNTSKLVRVERLYSDITTVCVAGASGRVVPLKDCRGTAAAPYVCEQDAAAE